MNKQEEKSARLVEFIEQFVDGNGYAPSIREMMIGLEYSSTSVVAYRLIMLERQGRITWQERIARSVRVVPPEDAVTIRLVGDDARLLRQVVGEADPRDFVVSAARNYIRGWRPTTNGQVDRG